MLVKELHLGCLLCKLLVAFDEESYDAEDREDKSALIGEEVQKVGAEPDCCRLTECWAEILKVVKSCRVWLCISIECIVSE